MWRRLDVPLQLALCQLEAARILPADLSAAESARDESRTILEGRAPSRSSSASRPT